MAQVDQLSEDDDERVADWDRIGRAFRQPFDPDDVDFRVQGKASEQTGKAQVVAYVDARCVQDRLDAVVGPGNWSFDWEATVVDKGDVQVAKGTLTVFGVSKSDAGSASNFEQSLGAVSHCFKRAAVQWGIGRYLYGLPMAWVAVERGGRIPAPVLRDLRAQLPRPNSAKGAKPEQPKRTVAIVREDATEVNTATGEVTRPTPLPSRDAQISLQKLYERAKALGMTATQWGQLKRDCGDKAAAIEQRIAVLEAAQPRQMSEDARDDALFAGGPLQ